MIISIETIVNSKLNNVWSAWVNPDDIVQWNFASDDWCCPSAENDLVVGGEFNYRMEARDGSFGFDFEGVYTDLIPEKMIKFDLGDERDVSVEFVEVSEGVKVIESFEAEDEHSAQQQKDGWQSILNNFKKYVESKGH